jgi:hypothetical protein
LNGDTAHVAGSDGSAIEMFVRTLVSVEPLNDVVPHDYVLSQNFPNPFNPTTGIQFSIPREGFRTLKVYDMLGKEVSTLLEEQINPGTYVYILTSGGARISKRMMLVK